MIHVGMSQAGLPAQEAPYIPPSGGSLYVAGISHFGGLSFLSQSARIGFTGYLQAANKSRFKAQGMLIIPAVKNYVSQGYIYLANKVFAYKLRGILAVASVIPVMVAGTIKRLAAVRYCTKGILQQQMQLHHKCKGTLKGERIHGYNVVARVAAVASSGFKAVGILQPVAQRMMLIFGKVAEQSKIRCKVNAYIATPVVKKMQITGTLRQRTAARMKLTGTVLTTVVRSVLAVTGYSSAAVMVSALYQRSQRLFESGNWFNNGGE